MTQEIKKSYKSTCCYCGVGCGVVINDKGNGRILVEGDKDHPVNKGMLCSKGMSLHYTVMDKTDRLLSPQMRLNRSMPLQNVDWDEAMDRTAAVFKTFISKYGPDSVAFYVSGQCLTEEYYLLNKIMKGFIGSNNIDTNSRLCMSSAVVAYKLSLGEDAVPVSYDDIELADVILVEGANPAWCHPILWRRVEAHKEANPHVKIINVDPRKTQTSSIADAHLAINPGTDVCLNHAIGRLLIENNAVDVDFIENSTDGFAAYKDTVLERSLEESANICGVNADEIRQVAGWIAKAKGFLTMWTMGLNQSVIGVNKNLSLINLNLITGHIGKPGSGPFSLTGQPNAMGGREVGGLANMLASHRELANPAHRLEMKRFWGGTDIAEKPGLTATEMFKALKEGSLKAIWIVCTNPMVSIPDLGLTEAALKNAKFVVVQDISNKTDTLAYADVVFPAAAWAEKEGTMTNAERRISYLNRVVQAPGKALPDWEILVKFAHKMGWGDTFNYKNVEEVYLEYVQSTEGTNIDIQGLNYQILKNNTVQWPYNKSSGSLFTDQKFYTANTKAQIHAVPDENQSESINEDYPLILITGRIRDQWHTMTKTAKVNKLNQHMPVAYCELNPVDARNRKLEDGQLVDIKSRRGDVRIKCKINEEIKLGTCFLPMHWSKINGYKDNRANNLTNSLVDPRSKEPDFKFTAVQVSAFKKVKEKILLIGAGSAGLGFINAYRALNQKDEIEVFSKEIYPFYNRVMLPDYISGSQKWEQLVKLREDQFIAANLKVHKGIGIVHIDRKNKVVLDSDGKVHGYDRLFLGMGSEAFMPRNFPKLKGIFNMRSRLDADALMPFLYPNGHAIIVGGGLLGLEMAASLREIEINVTVIQRIDRFMDRQLDPIGSQILHEEMIARGIEVYYNDEVEQFFGNEKIESIRLRSGRKIECQAIIVAAGTIASIELAKQARIESKRGILVNDYMQTSDPDVFACGEIAEWNQQIWGITAAAEQQAEAAARFMAGDISMPYKGSLSVNILKMQGLNLASMGMIEIPAGSHDYEEVVFIDKAKHYYKKCIIHHDRLVGAILIGDKAEFLEYKDLISNGIELSEKRLELLRSGKKPEPILGKLICSCNNVGEGNIQKAIKEGCTNMTMLCNTTGAGTGCGSCKPELRMLLESELVPTR